MSIFLTILLIAISLSMDTFTLSLSYGMLNLKRSTIIKISLTVGIFHFIMPLLGNKLGDIIYKIININENLIIGIIFLILSIELILSLYKKESLKIIDNFIQILFFSFAVSIDSFTVGIALDAIYGNKIFVVTIFMITSSIFTFIGLLFGKKIKELIGKKAEIIGIILLLILSISYFLKIHIY